MYMYIYMYIIYIYIYIYISKNIVCAGYRKSLKTLIVLGDMHENSLT